MAHDQSRVTQIRRDVGACGKLVRLTRSADINDKNPDFEWVRCGDCDSITRIPFIRNRDIEHIDDIQINE
jgi:hypothetical protein